MYEESKLPIDEIGLLRRWSAGSRGSGKRTSQFQIAEIKNTRKKADRGEFANDREARRGLGKWVTAGLPFYT
jgi:hypothetical protein